VRSLGYFIGCICILFIYDMHPMLYNISNLLMIDSLPFSKHALNASAAVMVRIPNDVFVFISFPLKPNAV
jgi:hypothetical protein